jgi:hypothetical protein
VICCLSYASSGSFRKEIVLILVPRQQSNRPTYAVLLRKIHTFLVPGVILFILGSTFRWEWKLEPNKHPNQAKV